MFFLLIGLGSAMAYCSRCALLHGRADCGHSRARLVKAGRQYSFGKWLYLLYLLAVLLVSEMFL